MAYTVKQLAKLAGVSVRTLHHYDAIGLLKPSRLRENGYREYGEDELLILQQILFFRELGFPLGAIRKIIGAPDFDVLEALREHKKFLRMKTERMKRLQATIDRTVGKLEKKRHMKDDELYAPFSKDEMEQYQKEAKTRWGHTDAYKQSTERVAKMSKEDMKRVNEEREEVLRAIVPLVDKGPRDPEVQKLIARHYDGLRAFYEPTPEMYKGLGEMYVSDERFGKYFKRFHPALPEFMRDAMAVYADTLMK